MSSAILRAPMRSAAVIAAGRKTLHTASSSRIPQFSKSAASLLRQQHAATSKSQLLTQCTRNYATATAAANGPMVTASPGPIKKKRFGFFKTLWRITYISTGLGVGYLAWHIYDSRHPPVQTEPDPSKKTLVILGSGWGSVSLLKKLDTENYNVVVISPRNFFLFTPLLPSCTTGTIEHRSIMEPLRHILRHKKASVKYYEAEATKIDMDKRVIHINDDSDIKGNMAENDVPFDYLVVGVGAENATFGIPGVKEHACFLKEISDAQQIRRRVMDCIETATFKDQTEAEKERLLHMVVVGGGPTGVEFAAELQDFFEEDLKKWVPEITDKFKVTLVEALPNVLPMFSKQLIEYTEKAFSAEHISVRTKTMVKNVTDTKIEVELTAPDGTKKKEDIPYGLLVWATGNAVRAITRDLMNQIPAQKNSRRGLAVNDYLVVDGTEGVWALGDCSASKYAPTAQVASQQGAFLARLFNSMAKTEAVEQEVALIEKGLTDSTPADQKAQLEAELALQVRNLKKIKQMSPFAYSHQGTLAYIGNNSAVADVSWFGGSMSSSTGGSLTFWFWRSAYLSMVFSVRNRILVLTDWLKVKTFGRDVSRE